jgi:hypothetical protein
VARACAGNEDVADFGAAATAEDDDVSAERQRVERVHIVSSSSSSAETSRPDTITITNLRKVYDTNQGAVGEGCCSSSSASSSSNQFNQVVVPPPTKKIAVRRLTLGIPDGQCFGLLGACSHSAAFPYRSHQTTKIAAILFTCSVNTKSHQPTTRSPQLYSLVLSRPNPTNQQQDHGNCIHLFCRDQIPPTNNKITANLFTCSVNSKPHQPTKRSRQIYSLILSTRNVFSTLQNVFFARPTWYLSFSCCFSFLLLLSLYLRTERRRQEHGDGRVDWRRASDRRRCVDRWLGYSTALSDLHSMINHSTNRCNNKNPFSFGNRKRKQTKC